MDEETKETDKGDETEETNSGTGKGGWRSGRGSTNLFKYRRGGRTSFKRDNYPTVALSSVDTKLSYREYVINEQEDVTMEAAEQGYERYVVVFG